MLGNLLQAFGLTGDLNIRDPCGMPKYANSLNVESNIPPPYILSQVPANLLLLYVINPEVASVSLLLLPCGLPKAS